MSCVMGNLVNYINLLSNGLFDAFLWVTEPAGETGQIMGVGALIGVIATVVFKTLVNQEQLKQTNRSLHASLFEIWLYRHDPRMVLLAERDLFIANFRFLRAVLFPLAVTSLLVAPLLIQVHYHFGLERLAPGSPVLLMVELEGKSASWEQMQVSVGWREGTGEISLPVRQPSLAKLVWRIRPEGEDVSVLQIRSLNWSEEFPLFLKGSDRSIGSIRMKNNLAHLVFPRTTPLNPNSDFKKIHVDYPHASSPWLVWLTISSLVAALVTYWTMDYSLVSRSLA